MFTNMYNLRRRQRGEVCTSKTLLVKSCHSTHFDAAATVVTAAMVEEAVVEDAVIVAVGAVMVEGEVVVKVVMAVVVLLDVVWGAVEGGVSSMGTSKTIKVL